MEMRLGGLHLSTGEQPPWTVLLLPQRLWVTGLELTVGLGEGLTQPYPSCPCDVGLVISLCSMRTEIKYLPWPLRRNS